MISLKNRFCLVTLAFLSAHASFLKGAGNESAFLQDIERQSPQLAAPQLAAPQSPPRLEPAVSIDLEDARSQTNHEPSAARSALAMAVYPLDLMKKVSLCAMKAPLFFLAATSALLPQAHASSLMHPVIPPLQQIKEVSFSLSNQWDTETCVGRALNKTHRINFLHQKEACHTEACTPHVYPTCQNFGVRSLSGPDAFDMICDDWTCLPQSVHSSATQQIKKEIATCTKEACQEAGFPYTGHFTFLGPQSYIGDSSKTAFIDQHILASEKCFESFCQDYAHDTCTQEPSWWQSLFGISPCNEDLCVGRFIPDEEYKVARGVSQSLRTIAHKAIKACNGPDPDKKLLWLYARIFRRER
ncbi:MAG: hypothetical protein V6Z78_03745 [Holosporaceae bacterium]